MHVAEADSFLQAYQRYAATALTPAEADRYVARIFGARNYIVVDHIRRLPEKLPLLYMRLTR